MLSKADLKFWHTHGLRSPRVTAVTLVTRCMRALPRRYRFRMALVISVVIQPFFRGGRGFLFLWRLNSKNSREYALWRVLQFMDWHDIGFDPPTRIKGGEILKQAIDSGRGVMVIASHMVFNYMTVRYVYEAGYLAKTVAQDPVLPLYGLGKQAPVIQSCPTYMVTIRKWLQSGRLAMSMIDQGNWSMQNAVEFNTPNGPVIISNSLIRLAARLNAKVIFTAAHLTGGKVEIEFAAPAAASEGDYAAITDDFIRFLQSRVI